MNTQTNPNPWHSLDSIQTEMEIAIKGVVSACVSGDPDAMQAAFDKVHQLDHEQQQAVQSFRRDVLNQVRT